MENASACQVSVVIPCYNGARFVARTLESVFAQRELPVEIVVVNDGSSDRSLDVLAQFDGRITLLDGPNRGASAARQRGTLASRGTFLQYLDADDLLRPGAMAAKVDLLERTGADVACSDWQRWEEDRHGHFRAGRIVRMPMDVMTQDPELATFGAFWAPPAALLYRRSLVERIGAWPGHLPVIQDARFLQDAAHLGARFVHVPEVLADYRDHRSSSLSKRSRLAFVDDVFRNTLEIAQRWRAADAVTPARRAALANTLNYCAAEFFWLDAARFDETCRAFAQVSTEGGLCTRLAARVARLGWPLARAATAPARGAASARAHMRALGQAALQTLRRPATLDTP